MADILILSRLQNGYSRNVDVSNNTLVVLSIKVGGPSTNTELTKTILDLLVSNSHAPGSDNQNVVAGSGLSGGGSGATVNLSVDSTVVRTSGANAFTADQSMGSNKITNLADGTANSDAVNKGQMDAAIAAAAPSGYIKADGTVPFTANQSMGSNKLTSLADGTAASDAANKGQLDSAISGLSSVYVPLTQKGANNGVATLDAGGKVPVSQLPNSVMELQGFWNASTNTPSLSDGSGNPGDVYEVSVAGSHDFGNGSISFNVGDWAVYAADNKWHKSINSNEVVSVNGQTGSVTVNAINQLSGDVTTSAASGSESKVATIAAGAVTGSKIASDTITNSNINSSAAIAYSKLNLASSITNSDINASAAIAYSKLNLATSIVNSDISASAAIAYSKLALSNSITNSDLTTGVADQKTIIGGNGSALAVAEAPKLKRTLVAGESFAANTTFLVRWALSGETAGRVYKADKDASSSDKFNVVGLALATSAVSAGQNIEVITLGTHTLGSSDVAFNASDIGKAVFLSASGAFTVTSPSATNEAVVKVGVVQETTKVDVFSSQVIGIN